MDDDVIHDDMHIFLMMRLFSLQIGKEGPGFWVFLMASRTGVHNHRSSCTPSRLGNYENKTKRGREGENEKENRKGKERKKG